MQAAGRFLSGSLRAFVRSYMFEELILRHKCYDIKIEDKKKKKV